MDMDASMADSKEPQPILESVPTPNRKPLPASNAPIGGKRPNRRHVTAPVQALMGTSPKCMDRSARSPPRFVKVCQASSPNTCAKPCILERRPSDLSPPLSPLSPPVRAVKTLRFQSMRSPSPPVAREPPDSPKLPKPKARARSQSAPRRESDPFNLYRFVDAQSENGTFERALKEIKAGRKSSCWMWFVIPSPPYMKNNIEHGSSTNRKYAIRSDQEGKAYLNYEADGVDLRSNYFSILSAVCEHLVAGKAARSVIGGFDEPKLSSSIIFFERLTRNEDNELNSLLLKLAGLMNLQLATGN